MKNKGFSLVELIVVIAIIAILSGAVVGILNYQSDSDVNRCGRTLNSVFDKVRTETACKTNRTYLYIYMLNNNYYMFTSKKEPDQVEADGDLDNKHTKLANSKVSITYVVNDGTSDSNMTLEEGTPIVITYKKNTGAYQRVDGMFYSQIKLDNKKTQNTIHFVEGTGRQYIN